MNRLDRTVNPYLGKELKLAVAYYPEPIKDSSNLRPLNVTRPSTLTERLLDQFEIESWEILSKSDVSLFLESNRDVAINLLRAIRDIPSLIGKRFSFKLKLEKDPEIENFKTLFLFISGKFKPNEAFKLLQKIDQKWVSSHVDDISKFNINIEFSNNV